MTNSRFDRLFGGPPRDPRSLLAQRDMDLAASVQAVTEEVVLRLMRAWWQRPGCAESVPGRRRRAQLCCQRQDIARWRDSTNSGFSRPPVTPEVHSARLWRPITNSSESAASGRQCP